MLSNTVNYRTHRNRMLSPSLKRKERQKVDERLKTLNECSGLKINNEKTEALALGKSRSLWKGPHSD